MSTGSSGGGDLRLLGDSDGALLCFRAVETVTGYHPEVDLVTALDQGRAKRVGWLGQVDHNGQPSRPVIE